MRADEWEGGMNSTRDKSVRICAQSAPPELRCLRCAENVQVTQYVQKNKIQTLLVSKSGAQATHLRPEYRLAHVWLE